jgi:hypothetical protein
VRPRPPFSHPLSLLPSPLPHILLSSSHPLKAARISQHHLRPNRSPSALSG